MKRRGVWDDDVEPGQEPGSGNRTPRKGLAKHQYPQTLYPISHDIDERVLYERYLFEARMDGRKSYVKYFEQGHEVG